MAFLFKGQMADFVLQLGAYTQFRYTANFRESPPEGADSVVHGFLIPRTRVFMEGLFSQDFAYHLRLNITGEGEFSLLTAYVSFKFRDV